jgi:type II secretory pathway predicted ATPase ExeA
MYLKYYGFTKQPFQTTPDADFLFLSPSHKEALASIIYGIEQRKGFIAITGEVGVGKTLILRSYLETVEKTKQKTIYIFNPRVTFESLLITILKELGVEPISGQATEMVSQLHELSIAEYRNGGVLVLVIDEAQNIPAETLEGIRMLSNLETSTEKLIQIVLVGQPELETLLDRHELRQVRERIAVRTRILPLTKTDSFAYIDHRLAHARFKKRPIFSKGAVNLIVKTAKGIPRRLNIICDSALITGYGYQQPTVSRKIAKEVIADFDGPGFLHVWKVRSAYALAALLTLVFPVIVYLGIVVKAPSVNVSAASPDVNQLDPKTEENVAGFEGSTKNSGSSETVKNAGSSETQNPANSEPAKGAVDSQTTRSTTRSEIVTTESAELAETARLLNVLLDSVRIVVEKAQATINNPRLDHKGFSPSAFEAQLRSEFLSRTGHDLRNLAPAAMPERAKPLLVRLAFFMQKAAQGPSIIHTREMDAAGRGVNHAMTTLQRGATGPKVTALQQALQGRGFPPGNLDGDFGLGTERAVLAFQKGAGLLPDGIAGPKTLAALRIAQPLIKKNGIGFNGFTPAAFGTSVAAQISKDTELKFRQIGPPGVSPVYPDNKTDEADEQDVESIQKSSQNR